MGVKGGKEVAAKFARIPDAVRKRVEAALLKGAGLTLDEMKRLTPFDAANPGAHARDGLTIVVEKGGLRVHVGLPSRELASDYFWFRFLDGGTKGGEVTYWRRTKEGRTRHTMNVPARAALHIREKALDGNADEVERLVREALQQGINEA